LLAVLPVNDFAQTRRKRAIVRKKPVTVGSAQQPKPELQCTTQTSGNEEMTYLVGAGKLSKKDKKRIEDSWGKLIVPQGETERAKEIRQNAINFRQQKIDTIVESYKIWEKFHPNATGEEIKNRLADQQQAIKNLTDNAILKKRVAEKRWDWREQYIDVGPVMNQGERCNTCWAFAATSAAAASQQIISMQNLMDYRVMDRGELLILPPAFSYWAANPEPFVQDLLNCMPIAEKEICRSGWHGRAFDFMVYGEGMPMAFADGYSDIDKKTGKQITYRRLYKPGQKLACRPHYGFRKANSWDYVNSPPDLLPTVEQLKTALIEHGPLVAPIVYDKCLERYRGGVFNEKNLDRINHAVLLVGWDDAKEAWLVKNSWGEEWGEKGFGWIKYGSNNIGVFAAWIDAAKD
jgi:hypothetical protein